MRYLKGTRNLGKVISSLTFPTSNHLIRKALTPWNRTANSWAVMWMSSIENQPRHRISSNRKKSSLSDKL